MKQSSLRYIGLFDLVLVAVFLAVFGLPALTAGVILPGMLVAGVLLVLAGSVATLSLGPVTITWRQLVGVSYALFALVMPASYAPAVLGGTATMAEIGLFVAMGIGGLTILFFGFDVARDGEHFQIESNVETVVGR